MLTVWHISAFAMIFQIHVLMLVVVSSIFVLQLVAKTSTHPLQYASVYQSLRRLVYHFY